MAYKERNVYVEELTKEQVEALPEYNENLTIASDQEQRVRAVLCLLLATTTASQAYKFGIYDQDRESYFYQTNDDIIKSIQEG